MISVIIPVYNVEKYLCQAIDSVLAQTYKDIEIILVEDKSKDSSAEILREYETRDDRIRVIYHEANKGLSGARNTGIKNATGDYLFFMDSDDFIHPETLEKMINAIGDGIEVVVGSHVDYYESATSTAPTKGAAHAATASDAEHTTNATHTAQEIKFTPINKPARCYSGINFLCSASDDLNSNMFIDSITAWGKLYSREAFGHTLYPQGRLHEDEYVTYKILTNQERIAYVDAPFYYYRKREGSIMDNENLWSRWDTIDALDEKVDYFMELEEAHMAVRTMERLLIKLIQLFRYSQVEKLSEETIQNARTCYKRNYSDRMKLLTQKKENRRIMTTRNKIKFGMFYHFRPVYMAAWKLKETIRGTK